MKSGCRLSVRLVIAAVGFGTAAAVAQTTDLVATDVYFRDQPGDVGNRVDNPQVGQQLYPHVAFNLNGAAALTGKIWNLELDGTVLCSLVATEPTGSQVGWCISPWTVTAGNHTLRGFLDPD